MLTRIWRGISPELTRSKKIFKILLGGGTIRGLTHSANATSCQPPSAPSTNRTPLNFSSRILSSFPRGHAMAPAHRTRFDGQKQAIEQITENRNENNSRIHVRAIHRALFIEDEKAQALAANNHLRGRNQDQRDR